jgi:hypothetical protein
MTKLSSAFGSNYQQMRREILTRKFELGGFTFKVRVPLVAETDAIYRRIQEPSENRIQEIYQSLVAPLLKYKEDPEAAESGFEFLENDTLVQGKSLREAAKNKAMTEARILEYVRLLVPENPENSLDDISYADIEAEWPLNVQLSLCEKIGEVISPTYKEVRGN